MKYKYVAISKNAKGYFRTLKDMEYHIPEFGYDIVICYRYIGNESELTRKDIIRIYVKGNRLPRKDWWKVW